MKLAHIYIEEHKALKRLNIPINGRFECFYKDGSLKLTKRDDILSDYYKGIDISAVVGKNGTGKTTILNFLETLVLSSDSSGLIVFYCDFENCFYICNINHCKLDGVVDSSELKENEINFKFVSNHKEFFEKNKIRLININNISPEQSGLTLVRSKSHSSIINLTLKYNTRTQEQKRYYFSKLLKYFKEYYSNESFHEDIYFELGINSSPARIVYRALENNSNNKIEHVVRSWTQHLNNIKLFEGGTIFNNLVGMNIISILSLLSKSSDISSDKQNRILLHLLYLFADYNMNNVNDTPYHIMLQMFVSSTDKYLNEAIGYFEPVSESDRELIGNINFNLLKKQLERVLNYLSELANLIDVHELKYTQVNSSVCKLEDYLLINEISELVDNMPDEIASNIRLGWRGVSTGELAYSHIFSEIYHYLTRENVGDSNSIIVIDEVDLYLHPEWQREFVSKIINLISYCHNINNVPLPQVIMTTHSPIITGDFLPRDIISLYKDKDEYGVYKKEVCVRPSLGFGTSISDLYLSGMHLDAVFGTHSKQYIDSIISRAKENNLTNFDRELIQQISDKHIRKYLLTS
ncbi:AAA family ATPase [Vibrio campbellii]|uniref:AAA family ATPase n=1 Tax=Vibrio campbellii TaxID=680 RepID=UPI0013152424|nr:AAA family ATPase [Vibrio campbellii]